MTLKSFGRVTDLFDKVFEELAFCARGLTLVAVKTSRCSLTSKGSTSPPERTTSPSSSSRVAKAFMRFFSRTPT
jgi:hypothetical protein